MSAARRARGQKLAAHIATGTYMPKPRKSHYQHPEIVALQNDEIRAKRQQIDAHRGTTDPRIEAVVEDDRRVDPHWAYRPSQSVRQPIRLIQLR